MRDEYDFSQADARKNPYADKLREQLTPDYIVSHLVTSDYLGAAHKGAILRMLLGSPELQEEVKKFLDSKKF